MGILPLENLSWPGVFQKPAGQNQCPSAPALERRQQNLQLDDIAEKKPLLRRRCQIALSRQDSLQDGDERFRSVGKPG